MAERTLPVLDASSALISDAGEGDVDVLRELVGEYADWQGWLPSDREAELAALPGNYEALLVARVGNEPAGCVALKRLPDGACEMKRLYVRPRARGSGLGRALVEVAISRARELGYKVLRLDTLSTMDAARSLYRSVGFQPIERYNNNQIPGVLFFEREL